MLTYGNQPLRASKNSMSIPNTHVAAWFKPLVMVASPCAIAKCCRSLTLKTLRDVPFNMPFYTRLSFELIPTKELSSSLFSVIQEEIRRGLDPIRPAAMRRRFAANADDFFSCVST